MTRRPNPGPTPKPPAKSAVKVLTAAARRITGKGLKLRNKTAVGWDVEAWEFYSTTGELHYLANSVANAMSMVELYVAKRTEDGWIRVEDENDPAVVALDALAGDSPTGQSELIKRFGLNLFVAGDSYLIGHPHEDELQSDPALGLPVLRSGPDLESLCWKVYSAFEVKFDAGKVKIRGVEHMEDDCVVIRVWRSHPMNGDFADSPVRAAVYILRELAALTKYVSAQMDSRFVGSGIVWMPESALAVSGGALEDDQDSETFLETVVKVASIAIKDRDSAESMVPIFATLPDEIAWRPEHMSWASPLDNMAKDLRDEAIRRLALSLDAPAEVLLGIGATNHWCVDDATEILVRGRGFVRQAELSVGDDVWALDHETGLSSWQPVLDIYRADVENQPMRHMENAAHSSMTTPEHRWPVVRRVHSGGEYVDNARAWRTSATLKGRDLFTMNAPSEDRPIEAKYSDALVELLAWIWTDGHIREGSGTVTITQSHTANPEKCARIRRCLTELYGPEATDRTHLSPKSRRATWATSVTEDRHQLGGPTTHFRLTKMASEPLLAFFGHHKQVHLDVIDAMTQAQLELFIHASLLADGHHYATGYQDIWQRQADDLVPFEYALLLAGYATSKTTHADGSATVRALRKTMTGPMHAASETARTGRGDAVDREVLYTGTVWCPVTPKSTWLARRNGVVHFTGNSAWAIQDDYTKTHILPAIGIIRDALVREYLRPILEANGVTNPQDYSIEADASALTLRPNRSTEALSLYDKDLITAASAREAMGFGEEDAPEVKATDEAVQRALDMIVQAPSLAQDPGLPALVNQIRLILGVPTVDYGPEAEPAVEEAAPVEVVETEPDPAGEVEPGPPQTEIPGEAA